MLKYRFVSHTADVRFFSYGNTLEELLANSMLAMFDTQANISKIGKAVKNGVAVSKELKIHTLATSERDILWYILQSALSELDSIYAYGYAVKDVRITKGSKGIIAKASISYIDQSQEYSRIYVKGVSGYELSVAKRNGKYVASVVVDI